MRDLQVLLDLTDGSKDAILNVVWQSADRAVKNYCKRDFEIQTYTEIRDGNNQTDLALYQRPAYAIATTGTLTQNAATVTGLADTSNLIVGMPCGGTGIGVGATILSVDSGTQVTLNKNSTQGGSQSLVFGISVWMDMRAFRGQAPTAFPDATQLRAGIDYILQVENGSTGESHCGILNRLGGGVTPAQLDWPWEWRKGTLTTRLPPAWPYGIGNLKIQYTAGYTAAKMPSDLRQAVYQLAVEMYRLRKFYGQVLGSESLADYSWAAMILQRPLMSDTRQLLARYREVAA